MKSSMSEEQWEDVIKEWQSGGEKLAYFARSRGINEHQLWYWKDKLLGRGKKSAPEFAPVVVPYDKDEVELTVSGIKIKLPLTLPAEKFLSIVRCLAQ